MSSINAKAVSDMFKFTEKAKSKIQEATKEIMLEIGRRLVYRSPIGNPAIWKDVRWPKGYEPGHFVNNWQVGRDFVPIGVIVGSDPTGLKSLERISHLGRWQYGHVYYFVNNVPYAFVLENGHSSQAPFGIVRITVKEYQQIALQAAVKVRNS